MNDDLIKVPGEGALQQEIPEGSGSRGDRGEPRLWSPVRTPSVLMFLDREVWTSILHEGARDLSPQPSSWGPGLPPTKGTDRRDGGGWEVGWGRSSPSCHSRHSDAQK